MFIQVWLFLNVTKNRLQYEPFKAPKWPEFAVEARVLSRGAVFTEVIQRGRRRMWSGGERFQFDLQVPTTLSPQIFLRSNPCCTSTNSRPPCLLLWNFSEGNEIWFVPLGLAERSKCLFHFRLHTVHWKYKHTLHPQHMLPEAKTDNSCPIVWFALDFKLCALHVHQHVQLSEKRFETADVCHLLQNTLLHHDKL